MLTEGTPTSVGVSVPVLEADVEDRLDANVESMIITSGLDERVVGAAEDRLDADVGSMIITSGELSTIVFG